MVRAAATYRPRSASTRSTGSKENARNSGRSSWASRSQNHGAACQVAADAQCVAVGEKGGAGFDLHDVGATERAQSDQWALNGLAEQIRTEFAVDVVDADQREAGEQQPDKRLSVSSSSLPAATTGQGLPVQSALVRSPRYDLPVPAVLARMA